MATYFTARSAFKPYSFEELIAPLNMYKTEYDKREAELQAMAEASAPWQERLDPVLDKEAYDKYQSYMEGLDKVVSDFNTSGLGIPRQDFFNLRKKYMAEIAPLETAQKKLEEEQKRRYQAGPNVVYSNPDLRIGDFMGGATPNTISNDLKTVQARTADKAARAATALFSDPEWSSVNGQYYQIATANGMPYDALELVLSDTLESNPNISESLKDKARAFKRIYDDEVVATQMNKFDTPEQEQINNAITSGLYAGLATPKYEYKQNLGYEDATERLRRQILEGGVQRDAAGNIIGTVQLPTYDVEGNVVPTTSGSTSSSSSAGTSSGRGSGTSRLPLLTHPIMIKKDRVSTVSNTQALEGEAVSIDSLNPEEKVQALLSMGIDIKADVNGNYGDTAVNTAIENNRAFITSAYEFRKSANGKELYCIPRKPIIPGEFEGEQIDSDKYYNPSGNKTTNEGNNEG